MTSFCSKKVQGGRGTPSPNSSSEWGHRRFLTHFGLVSAQYFDQKKRLAVALEPRSSSQTAHAEGSHGRVTAERLPPRPALPWPGAAVKAPAGLAWPRGRSVRGPPAFLMLLALL